MATGLGRARPAFRHEGFLSHARFRWAKSAATIAAIALVVYAVHDPGGRPSGGSWYGYATGTIGAGLILWLTALGFRKRAITPGRWSLRAWTSAHVYLGLALAVLATLHTGFRFGWDVHTLAYALMMAVIVTGMLGVLAYAVLPAALSENRGELSEAQMLDNLRSIDRQLFEAAQPLGHSDAALVQAALAETGLEPSLWRRLRGGDPAGPTARARAVLGTTGGGGAAIDQVDALLDRKLSSLQQLHRHLHLRALLEAWLFVHVPLTVALLAALTAHIVAVFFYW